MVLYPGGVPGWRYRQGSRLRYTTLATLLYTVLYPGVTVPVTAVEQCLGGTPWAQTCSWAWVRYPGKKSGPGLVTVLRGFFAGGQRAGRAGMDNNQIADG